MSGPLTVSAELSASTQRMKARTWRDAEAQAFEQGAIPTKQAARSANAARASRLLPRQRPRSPDRQASRDRRRQLGGSSALPEPPLPVSGTKRVVVGILDSVDDFGSHAVSDRVATRAIFSCIRRWTRALQRVAPVGFDLAQRRHRGVPPIC